VNPKMEEEAWLRHRSAGAAAAAAAAVRVAAAPHQPAAVRVAAAPHQPAAVRAAAAADLHQHLSLPGPQELVEAQEARPPVMLLMVAAVAGRHRTARTQR
jgi:hypothetical protein